jgi:hypothetical protein
MFHEPLLLYIAATARTASTVLVAERDTQVIAKEEVDPPRLGAPPEEEAVVSASPHEEPPAAPSLTEPLMSTHASVLVDSVGPPSAEVCRATASFP